MRRTRIKRSYEVVAESLRHLAGLMCDKPDNFSVEDGKALDRALRSCKGIIDIDVVWVRWRYVAEQRDWITDKEIVFTGARFGYKA